MSDTYDAVYQAVRRNIGACDTDSAIRSVLRESFGNAECLLQSVANDYRDAAYQQARPSAIFRPRIGIDGNQWIAVYGDNIQDGVAGCGESPELAMDDFDRAWNAKLGAK